MHAEQLTISVLYGTGIRRPDIQEILESLPQLKVLGHSCEPQNLLVPQKGAAPDVILVELNGEKKLPEWLKHLAQGLPQATVLVCSHSREPDFLIRVMQAGVREFLPLPLTRSDLEGALERICTAKKRLQSGDHSQGRVIVVTGHKGGAGATAIAVNLAKALADLTSERLALVDLGRPFPDVGNFLGNDENYTIIDLIQNLSDLDHTFMQRITQPYEWKLAILHGFHDLREQDHIEPEALEKIFHILRSSYKWIIVDLGHWLDGFFIQVVREADVVLLLTELTIPDLKNLKKLWPIIQEWDQVAEKVKVVVNRHHKGNGLRVRDLELVINQKAFEILPSDYQAMIEAVNQGMPLASTAPRSKLYQGLQRLALRLKEENKGAKEEAAPASAPARRFWIFSKGRT